MRIFAVGDFHANDELKQATIDHITSEDYDLVLFVGDYEESEYYESLIDELQLPFLSLTGNWDFEFEPPENGEYENLFNYQEVEYRDYKIVLLGSVYPEDFIDQVRDFFEGTPQEKRIIASHYPPHMLGDLTRSGTRAGFPEFRELIMQEQPALWCCGHIHEDYGSFSLLGTTVLNCAAKESGKGWAIELGDDGITSTEEIVLDDDLAEQY